MRVALLTAYLLVCMVAARAQKLVTDAPVAKPGGTAYVGKYTATSVFSAGPTFHFTAPVTITSIAYDPGPVGAQELAIRGLYGCSYNKVTAAGTVCGIETEIASQYPGWRYGTLRVTTTSGVFTIPVEWQSIGAQVVVTPGIVSTPQGAAGVTGNALSVDALGNIYLSKSDSVIRKIDATTGAVTIVAGTLNNPNNAGDGGPATAAAIQYPIDVAASPAGDIFLVSSFPFANDPIRKVDGSTGIISTVAGITTGRGPTLVSSSGSGTDGAVAVDDQGNIYATATHTQTLAVTPSDGSGLKALIGSTSPDGSGGCNAGLGLTPTSLAVSEGYVYFATTSASVYRISADTSACHAPVLVAGTGTAGNSGDGGLATKAAIGAVNGLAIDAAGDVYLADATNGVVRVVSAATGIITTIGYGWSSLALDVRGNLYVLSAAGMVQKTNVSAGALSYADTGVQQMSSDSAKSLLFTNIGNDALSETGSVATVSSDNFALDTGVTTCGVGNATALGAGESCIAGADFKPQTTGALTGTLSVGGVSATLSGKGIGATSTVTKASYSVSVNPREVVLQGGQSSAAQFVFAPSGGFKGAIRFACTGLPMGAGCSFAPATLTADGSDKQQTSTLTITTRGASNAIAMKTVSGKGVTLASLLGFNGMLLMWLKLRRKGDASMKLMSMFLLLSLGVAGATGCGSGGAIVPTGSFTPMGSSTVSVVSTSVSDGSSQTATFILTVK